MTIVNLRQVFLALPNQQATREQFAAVTKVSSYHFTQQFFSCSSSSLSIGVGVSIYVEEKALCFKCVNMCVSVCHTKTTQLIFRKHYIIINLF